jgi:(2Fe-2S) ferredoxin
MRAEMKRRGLSPLIRANKAGCLEQCEHGPTVAIYPQGIFYGGVRLEDVPRIVEETFVNGRVLEDLRIADACLNNPDCEHVRARRAAAAGAHEHSSPAARKQPGCSA